MGGDRDPSRPPGEPVAGTAASGPGVRVRRARRRRRSGLGPVGGGDRREAPSGEHWSYANVGWCVLGRAIETVTGMVWEEAMPRLLSPAGLPRRRGRRPRSSTGRSGMTHRPADPSRSSRAVPRLQPCGRHHRLDARGHAPVRRVAFADSVPAPLRVVHADVSIHGWFDAWGLGLGRFDWGGVEVWGWDGVVNGQRSVLRLLRTETVPWSSSATAAPGAPWRARPGGSRRPRGSGSTSPTERLDASPAVPEQLAAYTGVYGWPDRRVDVTESARGLLVSRTASPGGRAIDRRTFLLDRDDPDTPTITRRRRRGREARRALRHGVGTGGAFRTSDGAAIPPATAGITEIWVPSGVGVSRLSRNRTSSLPT